MLPRVLNTQDPGRSLGPSRQRTGVMQTAPVPSALHQASVWVLVLLKQETAMGKREDQAYRMRASKEHVPATPALCLTLHGQTQDRICFCWKAHLPCTQPRQIDNKMQEYAWKYKHPPKLNRLLEVATCFTYSPVQEAHGENWAAPAHQLEGPTLLQALLHGLLSTLHPDFGVEWTTTTTTVLIHSQPSPSSPDPVSGSWAGTYTVLFWCPMLASCLATHWKVWLLSNARAVNYTAIRKWPQNFLYC